ncbi:MAG: hypothetical protein KAV82_12780 [Phycisphaerae bacterium]|nr:hypothetical protein [Phycisphaerae bacterium]
MIIYFDESYDNDRNYILYGALFVPPSSTLHQQVTRIRAETGLGGEIKYNRCKNNAKLAVFQKIVDAFMDDTAYFRCVVVDQHGFNYSGFGRADEPLALKQARAYKKFAEMLLAKHVSRIENAVFLADAMTRCWGDEFLEKMRECFNPSGGKKTFRHLAEVSSALEQYQCLQVCDLLLGCVLNNLKPARKEPKNQIRRYLCKCLDVPNLLLTTWKDIPLAIAKNPSTKFNVWYWSEKKTPR